MSAEKRGHQRAGLVELPGFSSSRALVISGVGRKGCEEPRVLGVHEFCLGDGGQPGKDFLVLLSLQHFSVSCL